MQKKERKKNTETNQIYGRIMKLHFKMIEYLNFA